MSIDWITVIAQIANFLVLVWLLKHFLYRPILDGIDAREAEIARGMAEAGEAQKKAQTAEAKYRKQHTQLLSDQNTMVEQALKASEKQRDILLADARDKLEQEHKDWHKYLKLEHKKFTDQLHRAGSDTLLELMRKALRDLADETMEEAIIRHVSTRLQPLASELLQAAGDNTEAVATTRDLLHKSVQLQLQVEIERLLPGITLRFETDQQQAPGLILCAGGAQVAWTVDSYIDEFGNLLDQRLAAGVVGRTQPDGE